jgi:hypothetical protein
LDICVWWSFARCALGAVTYERAKRVANWDMIFLGGVHYALQGVDAAEPLLDMIVFIAEKLKTLCDLVADE